MALERLLTTMGTRCLAGPFIVSLHFALAACYFMFLLSFHSHVFKMFNSILFLYDLLQALLSPVRGGSKVVFCHQVIIFLEALLSKWYNCTM